MRIRVKFEKKDSVRYLGHLDIMRYFQRVFNRADVRMEYSIGYNPHQKMSFAQPLGVGILSCGEYLDAEIADGQDLDAIRDRMNAVCGDGFYVRSIREAEEGAKKAMAALQFAEYEINLNALLDSAPDAEAALKKAVETLLNEKSVLVIKKNKRGEKEVDIRPQIIELEVKDGKIRTLVTAGSDNNLKPDTLLSAIFGKTDIEYQREKITIKRTELYADGMVPLEKFQTV